jgi:hypothetical protein
MKLRQILFFRWRAPGHCGPKGFKLEAPGKKGKFKMKLHRSCFLVRELHDFVVQRGSPTRFELKCSKRARFEGFLQCSRASVKNMFLVFKPLV